MPSSSPLATLPYRTAPCRRGRLYTILYEYTYLYSWFDHYIFLQWICVVRYYSFDSFICFLHIFSIPSLSSSFPTLSPSLLFITHQLYRFFILWLLKYLSSFLSIAPSFAIQSLIPSRFHFQRSMLIFHSHLPRKKVL